MSTPHSEHPETAARGKFDIAILKEDIARKGSSAEAFLKLVGEKFYDGCYTFRVIKGFVVQFGHRGDKKKANMERIPESDKPIESSEKGGSSVLEILRKKENVKGTITMISGKTGQVFVNTGDNRRLDKDGTLPFGAIIEESLPAGNSRHTGMNLIESIYYDYKAGQGQIPAVNNNQVATKFPEMGRIDQCYRKGWGGLVRPLVDNATMGIYQPLDNSGQNLLYQNNEKMPIGLERNVSQMLNEIKSETVRALSFDRIDFSTTDQRNIYTKC